MYCLPELTHAQIEILAEKRFGKNVNHTFSMVKGLNLFGLLLCVPCLDCGVGVDGTLLNCSPPIS